MADLSPPRRQLFEALEEIASGAGDAGGQTEALRRALLDFGSETPDNLACAERIGVGAVGTYSGVRLASRPVLLSDLAHALEDGPMPEALRTAYPDLTEGDWDAFCRFVTLMLSLVDHSLAGE